jgi:hypothetical protein
MTTPLAINFFLFKNGLIWHIRIHSFMAPLTSPASMAAKLKIVSLNQISDWDILKTHCNMFHNPRPCFDVPSYSIHVDCGAHVSFHDATIANQLLNSGTLGVDTPGPLPSS